MYIFKYIIEYIFNGYMVLYIFNGAIFPIIMVILHGASEHISAMVFCPNCLLSDSHAQPSNLGGGISTWIPVQHIPYNALFSRMQIFANRSAPSTKEFFMIIFFRK